MDKSESYRQNAAKCLELADKTTEAMIRVGLIDMAQAWLELAEQAKKSSQADLVYAVPPQNRGIEVQN